MAKDEWNANLFLLRGAVHWRLDRKHYPVQQKKTKYPGDVNALLTLHATAVSRKFTKENLHIFFLLSARTNSVFWCANVRTPDVWWESARAQKLTMMRKIKEKGIFSGSVCWGRHLLAVQGDWLSNVFSPAIRTRHWRGIRENKYNCSNSSSSSQQTPRATVPIITIIMIVFASFLALFFSNPTANIYAAGYKQQEDLEEEDFHVKRRNMYI